MPYVEEFGRFLVELEYFAQLSSPLEHYEVLKLYDGVTTRSRAKEEWSESIETSIIRLVINHLIYNVFSPKFYF